MCVGTYVCAYMCHVYGGQRSALGVYFPSGSLPWFSHSYLEFPNSASPAGHQASSSKPPQC